MILVAIAINMRTLGITVATIVMPLVLPAMGQPLFLVLRAQAAFIC